MVCYGSKTADTAGCKIITVLEKVIRRTDDNTCNKKSDAFGYESFL
jgi:hypothetical protein